MKHANVAETNLKQLQVVLMFCFGFISSAL